MKAPGVRAGRRPPSRAAAHSTGWTALQKIHIPPFLDLLSYFSVDREWEGTGLVPRGTWRSSNSSEGGVNKEADEFRGLVFQLMQWNTVVFLKGLSFPMAGTAWSIPVPGHAWSRVNDVLCKIWSGFCIRLAKYASEAAGSSPCQTLLMCLK